MTSSIRSLLVVFLGFGCSAVIDPDGSRLGGGVDAGVDADRPDVVVVDGGTDTAADAGPCPRPATCEGNVLVRCEGGSVVNMDCGADRCDAGAQACVPVGDSWVPSNVDASMWDADAPDMEIDRDMTIDTSRCAEGEVVSIVGGEACVIVVGDFQIAERANLTIEGSRPVILMASGEVRISGFIDVSAYGTEPGPGGFRGGVRDLPDGGGSGRGISGQHLGEFEDGGGGGGGFCGAGARGGEGGRAAGGDGGPAVGAGMELQPLVGGSGGGRGRGAFFATGRNAGLGGAGGGALQISALGRIRFDGGGILAGGGGGGGGLSGDANWGSGGGGGAGGGILLEAPVIEGGGLLNAAAGGGGGASAFDGEGDDGQDGADADASAAGGVGGTGGGGTVDGGRGGGGTRLEGEPGDSDRDSPVNGGGGGGGAGCVILRVAEPFPPEGLFVTPLDSPGYRILSLRR